MESEKEVENGRYIILISGVSKGLGRALALEFGKLGHIIVGCSRNQNQLDSLQHHLSTISSLTHLLIKVDVSSNDEVKEMAETVLQKVGPPHIIVNNAGVINENVKMWEGCVEEFDNVIDTNIKGTANVIRNFIPHMISNNKKGIIVNMSSIYGRTAAPLISAYGSSKWGIEGLSKSLAKEVPKRITVVALDPGIINTEMLATHIGSHSASHYQTPQQWATKAASMILNLSSADNGASLTVEDPGILVR
ncbi:NADPH-dependent pterin aldehyde reductase-like isoform X1 [Cucumis melo]|uniref:NADPH-dependent pterin aldehyde reductase-like isoform X1 n=1 Tax=Cucumis melo TaxID=3656 RepID=A0ABM3L9P5_CUCME|nr:NADPH-dependent pterin aldehyde reductase-like isoform X1 [Cucumis melo]